jgi:hypothetical protein
MFFLHALAAKRKQLEQAGDVDALMNLPIVTVFEKSASPGGVWRSDRNRDNKKNCTLHDCQEFGGLWTLKNAHRWRLSMLLWTDFVHFWSWSSCIMISQSSSWYCRSDCITIGMSWNCMIAKHLAGFKWKIQVVVCCRSCSWRILFIFEAGQTASQSRKAAVGIAAVIALQFDFLTRYLP